MARDSEAIDDRQRPGGLALPTTKNDSKDDGAAAIPMMMMEVAVAWQRRLFFQNRKIELSQDGACLRKQDGIKKPIEIRSAATTALRPPRSAEAASTGR